MQGLRTFFPIDPERATDHLPINSSEKTSQDEQ